MLWLIRSLGLFLVLASFDFAQAQQSRSCKVDHTAPTDAEDAMARREYETAATLFAATLKDQPTDTEASAGLVRAELGRGHLTDALALARKDLVDHPGDALFLDVMGDVDLRRGEPEEAVKAFNAAVNTDPCLARAHFDVARFLDLEGMHASARKQLELAHSLAPRDPVVDRAWRNATFVYLTPEQRLARLKQHALDPNLTPEQKRASTDAIGAIEAQQRGDCKPVSEIPSATLQMVPISNGPTRPLFAVGLDVQMNGKRKRLEIDTGASGLLISRSSAISAGLVPEAEVATNGIGDHGPAGSYLTHVDDLRIGGMEFRNCMVRVLEKRSVLDVDGLIGTDVFRSYLVTLDTPGRELRLAPLPKRPDEAAAEKGLATTGDAAAAGESASVPVPRDRYRAPEMKDWTLIYRIGHQLIVPTRIGNAPQKLFIMDTGSAMALISPEAAREVTHVSGNDGLHVHGLSGEVNKVSEADSVTIRFAHVQQRIPYMTSIDTGNISRNLGLEIAGFIGFPTLSELVITIDYRDDLINVVYDPNHGFHAH